MTSFEAARVSSHFEYRVSSAVWSICGALLIEDTMFYWCHRLIHTKWLYQNIHKASLLAVFVILSEPHVTMIADDCVQVQIHHQYYVNVALGSEHAHPIEYFVGNLLPVAM